jgi:hypothetical protein
MRSWLKSRFDDPVEEGGSIDGYLPSADRAMVSQMQTGTRSLLFKPRSTAKPGTAEKAFERCSIVFRNGLTARG